MFAGACAPALGVPVRRGQLPCAGRKGARPRPAARDTGPVGDKEPSARPLIGVEDLETPAWAQGMASTAAAGVFAVGRSVPRTAAVMIGWAWRAAPGWTVAAGVVQVLAGVVTALGQRDEQQSGADPGDRQGGRRPRGEGPARWAVVTRARAGRPRRRPGAGWRARAARRAPRRRPGRRPRCRQPRGSARSRCAAASKPRPGRPRNAPCQPLGADPTRGRSATGELRWAPVARALSGQTPFPARIRPRTMWRRGSVCGRG